MIRGRLRALPLRARLLLIATGLTAVGLILTTAATAYLMRRDLISRVDDELGSAALIVAQEQINERAYDDLPTNYSVFLVSPSTGETRQLTRSTSTQALPDLPTLTKGDTARSTGTTVESVDGEGPLWRVLVRGLTTSDVLVVVATPLDTVDHTVAQLISLASLIGVAVLLALAAIGWYAVHRALRPLTLIEDTAAAIAEGDLGRRIPVHGAQDEVQSLARSLNSMLGQIERSFTLREKSEERMRQFVADASHELRTPLATVRGYAELHRQGALPDGGAVGTAMTRIESEARRMSGLVEDLLTLARLDEAPEEQMGPVDLTVVAADAAGDARTRAPERSVTVASTEGPLQAYVVRGSERRLRQVLANLLSNALAHTPSGTPVEVRLGLTDEGRTTVLEVRDHGPGLAPEAAAKVFERFYRLDRARSRESGGTGLGLAIVAAIVDQHDGRVGVAETPGGGATFVVELPTAGSQGAHTRL